MPADIRYADVPNEAWTSYGTGIQYPFTPAFVLGNVLFTDAEMDAWPSSGTPYTATASACPTSFTFTDFGTSITTIGEMDDFHEESCRIKGHACLWKASGDTAHLAKAIEGFDCSKDITSFLDQTGQDHLELSWAIPNLVTALAVVGRENYDSAAMDTFLRDVCYYHLDWYTGGNWFASMAASKVAIASYLEDNDLWTDAKGYTAFRIQQCIYHSDYDGGNINPIRGGSLANRLWPATVGQAPNQSPTQSHWWSADSGTSPYTASHSGYTYEDGVDVEMLRDLSHQTMTMTGFSQAALTMRACGDPASTEIIDRITAAAAWNGRRNLHWLQNGTLESASPAGTNASPAGPAGVTNLNNRFYGWWTVKRLLGDDAPAVIDTILTDPEIEPPLSYRGQNNQAIERFSEGTLV